ARTQDDGLDPFLAGPGAARGQPALDRARLRLAAEQRPVVRPDLVALVLRAVRERQGDLPRRQVGVERRLPPGHLLRRRRAVKRVAVEARDVARGGEVDGRAPPPQAAARAAGPARAPGAARAPARTADRAAAGTAAGPTRAAGASPRRVVE